MNPNWGGQREGPFHLLPWEIVNMSRYLSQVFAVLVEHGDIMIPHWETPGCQIIDSNCRLPAHCRLLVRIQGDGLFPTLWNISSQVQKPSLQTGGSTVCRTGIRQGQISETPVNGTNGAHAVLLWRRLHVCLVTTPTRVTSAPIGVMAVAMGDALVGDFRLN